MSERGCGIEGRGLYAALGLAAGCLALALFAGCDDDDGGGGGGPPTVTLDVDGSPVDLSFNTGGQYDSAMTRAEGTDSGSSMWSLVMFPGASTGTFATGSGAALAYVDAGGFFAADDGTPGTSYTITVTAYGPVGGRIEGTFSGVLIAAGGASVTITNGYFNVIREPDL